MIKSIKAFFVEDRVGKSWANSTYEDSNKQDPLVRLMYPEQ